MSEILKNGLLHALSTGKVTFDTYSVTEKSKIDLAAYGRSTLPKLSPCYCASALHFPIVPCHGRHHEKVGGTVKKFFPTFEMLPAPLAGDVCPVFMFCAAEIGPHLSLCV